MSRKRKGVVALVVREFSTIGLESDRPIILHHSPGKPRILVLR